LLELYERVHELVRKVQAIIGKSGSCQV
jgi:hypothetical protein